jgi:hypothetical protein
LPPISTAATTSSIFSHQPPCLLLVIICWLTHRSQWINLLTKDSDKANQASLTAGCNRITAQRPP